MGTPGSIVTPESIQDFNIVLFDGVCNLCQSSVKFIIRRDRRRRFKFASLQSTIGKQFLKTAGVSDDVLFTIVLIRRNQIYLQSDAALEIARDLDGMWPVVYIVKIIPRFIRDGIYKFISKHRYSWFGKQQTCMIPDISVRERFLE